MLWQRREGLTVHVLGTGMFAAIRQVHAEVIKSIELLNRVFTVDRLDPNGNGHAKSNECYYWWRSDPR